MRIGRSRRKIDQRLRAAKDQARQLASWRTYVTRYPGLSLAAAVGAGLAVSAGFRTRRVAPRLGRMLLRQATAAFKSQLWKELRRAWNASDSNHGDSA